METHHCYDQSTALNYQCFVNEWGKLKCPPPSTSPVTKPSPVIFGLEPALTGLSSLTATVQVPVLMGLFYPIPLLNLGPCASILCQSPLCLSLILAPVCPWGPHVVGTVNRHSTQEIWDKFCTHSSLSGHLANPSSCNTFLETLSPGHCAWALGLVSPFSSLTRSTVSTFTFGLPTAAYIHSFLFFF